MKPSKEAIQAAIDAENGVDIVAALKAAYEIDFAALEQENERLDRLWKLETARAQQAEGEQRKVEGGQKTEHIANRCPSCGNQTLFIGKGGWLTCSWIGCENPSIDDAQRQTIRKLAEALEVMWSGRHTFVASHELDKDTCWTCRGDLRSIQHFRKGETPESDLAMARAALDAAEPFLKEKT